MEYIIMGLVVDQKTKEYMDKGLSKKEAKSKAHEHCALTNTCRGCSKTIQADWWSWKVGYCKDCMG